jgi:hypothetical protein
MNQHIGGILCSTLQLPATANVPSSPIFVTMMMEAKGSSKMLVLTRATWHNIRENGILHSHCCENIKSYINFLVHKSLLTNYKTRHIQSIPTHLFLKIQFNTTVPTTMKSFDWHTSSDFLTKMVYASIYETLEE